MFIYKFDIILYVVLLQICSIKCLFFLYSTNIKHDMTNTCSIPFLPQTYISTNVRRERKDTKQTAMLTIPSFEIRIPHPDNGRLVASDLLRFFVIPILQCTKQSFQYNKCYEFLMNYIWCTRFQFYFRVMLTYIINNNLFFIFSFSL